MLLLVFEEPQRVLLKVLLTSILSDITLLKTLTKSSSKEH